MPSDPTLASSMTAAAQLLRDARHLVVFTGAGISTESGLPDYRGPDGVWTRRDQGLPPPRGRGIADVRPNAAHMALTELDRRGHLAFLITQNVDDLHRKSGVAPERLAELHGNSLRLRCPACQETCPRQPVPGPCPCGTPPEWFVSSVINFGDSLPDQDLTRSFAHAERADVVLVVGSTLLVTPAADIPRVAVERGAKLIIVNLGETPLDPLATVVIAGKAGEVVPRLVELALA